MSQLHFHQLPVSAKISIAVTAFMAWVLIEEFIIDRHHLDAFLPFYKVGNLCVYDALAATLIVATIAIMNRKPS